jgi:ribosomal-protein-alanine N-acetyltransferase
VKWELNPIRYLEDLGIVLEENSDANFLLETAEKIGLEDVSQWASKEKFQTLLDIDHLVAFVAVFIDPITKLRTPIGEVVGGYEEEGRIWIELLTVDPFYRRKSVAKGLVHRLAQTGKEKGYRALFVDLDDDNYDALKFYKAVGFKKVGNIGGYYYDASTAIVMMRSL